MRKLVRESLHEKAINLYEEGEENEESSELEVLDKLDKSLDVLGKTIAKNIVAKKDELLAVDKKGDGKEKEEKISESFTPLNESAVLTVATLVLGMPKIIEIIAKVVKFTGKVLKSNKIKNKGEALKKFSHKLETNMLKPIKWAWKKATGANDKQAEKAAQIIHLVIIGALAVATGLDLAGAIKSANTVLTAEEIGKLSLKLPEVIKDLRILAA